MNELFYGIDTSAYTTSVAVCDGSGRLLADTRLPLTVGEGERGLRQSDAVFLHIKNFGEWLSRERIDGCIKAVCVSTAPRDTDGSYMPVFTVGRSMAGMLAVGANCPLYETSHQHGHIYAALPEEFDSGKLLAVHASGGTTEVLAVCIDGGFVVDISLLGGTRDITAGKLIDRTGVLMGLPFPAGEPIERIAKRGDVRLCVTTDGIDCNLSGAETQAERAVKSGADNSAVAFAVLDCIAETVGRMLAAASEATGIKRALLMGGVMQNSYIKEKLTGVLGARDIAAVCAMRGRSCDNAAGLARLCRLKFLSEVK